jgi:hypothetical protein
MFKNSDASAIQEIKTYISILEEEKNILKTLVAKNKEKINQKIK